MANVEFGTVKTVIILSIVIACFAVLWPKIFYPMLTGNRINQDESDNYDGCCDVMFETDINAIKIMNDLCGSILHRQADFNPKLSQAFQQGKLSKEVINTCRTEVMNMCGIDIAEFLNKKEKIGHSYKQMLDEIRSFNISICLRHNFGVNPGLLGAPRRMRIWSLTTPRHLRQERPMHLRPEIIHPALWERGRAIPHSHADPRLSDGRNQGRIRSGTRPPLGGPGKVVPPPKTGGTISVIMPIYTIGIILFFTYTVMKIFSRKANGGNEYRDFHSDPEFRRVVFSEDYSNGCAARIGEDGLHSRRMHEISCKRKCSGDSTRLGWKERDTRDIEIDHLKKRLEETEKAMERIVAQMGIVPKELLPKAPKTLRSSPHKVRDPILDTACSMSLIGHCECRTLTEQLLQRPLNITTPLTSLMSAIAGLLAEVDQQLNREGETQNQYSTELKGKKNLEEFCAEEVPPVKKALDSTKQVDITSKEVKNGHVGAYHELSNEEDSKPKVKVMGLELMAECEGGQKWSRPATPNLGVGGSSRPTTPIPPPYSPEPQNIFLEGALPQQSQLLVTDSKTQTLTLPDADEPEPPVILSSKMTLSLISLDATLPEDSTHHDQPLTQSQADVRSDFDDNLGTADSTLLDVDSELIDENVSHEYESAGEQEEILSGSISRQVNENTKENPSLNYTTATSEGAEAVTEQDLEDTGADVSNLDGLDLAEDQEDVQNENLKLCNGNSKEADEPHEQEPTQSRDSQEI